MKSFIVLALDPASIIATRIVPVEPNETAKPSIKVLSAIAVVERKRYLGAMRTPKQVAPPAISPRSVVCVNGLFGSFHQ